MCRRVLFLSLSVLLTVGTAFFTQAAAPELRHYEMNKNLNVQFSNADHMIAEIRSAMRSRVETIIITYQSHADQMEDITAAVRELMQYACAETNEPCEGDYLYYQYGGYQMEYSYQEADGVFEYELRIQPDYYTNKAQESKTDFAVFEAIAAIALPENACVYDKIHAVNAYLSARVDYDLIHKKNGHYHLKSTAYGALVNGYAVCQGYAVAAYRLLRELGEECRVITGTVLLPDGSAEEHAWNIVRIGDVYYQLDITWNDRLKTDRYFLCGLSDFPDHQPDAEYLNAAFLAQYPIADSCYRKEP